MLPRLLSLAFVAALASTAPVAARLIAMEPDFEVYGLEQLTGRYGQAYPGYEQWGAQSMANVGLMQQQQQQLPLRGIQQQQLADEDMDMDQMQFGNVGMQEDQMQFGGNIGVNRGMLLSNAMATGINPRNVQMNFGLGQQGVLPTATYGSTATTVMPAYGAGYGVPTLGAAGFGGVGAFGAGSGSGLGASKKTTTAAPIYAQAMVVPKIITQPILRPHSVTQPILQQQLINQPIVETRQVIQPVIRRIITQPIIRPEIFESTTIQPTLKTETTVQPHIVQQTVVTPTLMNQFEEQAPIQEAPKVNVQAPVVQPTISGKKQGGALSGFAYGGR